MLIRLRRTICAPLQGQTAVTGMPGGPYGKFSTPKTGVKKAERPSLVFYFEKNKMRFFQNNPYKITISPADTCLSRDCHRLHNQDIGVFGFSYCLIWQSYGFCVTLRLQIKTGGHKTWKISYTCTYIHTTRYSTDRPVYRSWSTRPWATACAAWPSPTTAT